MYTVLATTWWNTPSALMIVAVVVAVILLTLIAITVAFSVHPPLLGLLISGVALVAGWYAAATQISPGKFAAENASALQGALHETYGANIINLEAFAGTLPESAPYTVTGTQVELPEGRQVICDLTLGAAPSDARAFCGGVESRRLTP